MSQNMAELSDSFAGTLQPWWQWHDEDPDAWKLQDNRLYLKRYTGNGFYARRGHRVPVLNHPRVSLRDGLCAQVKVGFDVDKPAGQGGIKFWYDDGTFAKLVIEYWWDRGIHIIFLKQVDGSPCHEKDIDERDLYWGKLSAELRITYRGGVFVTECRDIGGEWNPHFTVPALPDRGTVHVGLFAQADGPAHDWIWFEDFRLRLGDEVNAT